MSARHDLAICGGIPLCGVCNQQAATEGFRGTGPDDHEHVGDIVTCPDCGRKFDPLEPLRVTESVATEAMIGGERSFDDTKQLVRKAIADKLQGELGFSYVWVYISDLTAAAVVYAANDDDLYQCEYAIDDAGVVTLGSPVKVVRTYAPDPTVSGATVAEMRDQITTSSRVIEAKGKAEDGGRIFKVRIIAYGDSLNGRRYPEAVMRAAVPLYEGAKAYDHHRTVEELATGTIAGLVGAFRAVAAESDGLYADLHLLPSAVHAAESLDASLAGQDDGLEPLIGLSHDVMALFKPITEGGRQLQEATAIAKVNSADLVSDPAAGGKASRVVANINPPGAEPTRAKEADVPPTKDEILAAFKDATADELAAVGLAKVAETAIVPAVPPVPPVPEKVLEGVVAQPKTGWMAKAMIKAMVEDAGLPANAVEAITGALPDRIVEADVTAQISAVKGGLAILERASLVPTVTVTVTQESIEKKQAALDAFFDGRYGEGYHSFKQAYEDFTGRRPRSWDEDFNRTILRECYGPGFDSSQRAEESLSSASWAQVLGDSITRRMMAEYKLPELQTWRQIVSSTVPVNDFRTQRVGRIGGYGTLPVVAEGGPYQPLDSPGDEEATYGINKKGGTEDITLEMIANDDVRKISAIPVKLGRAAAQTLYRFVWGFLRDNATCTYDGVPLFHSSHGTNVTTSALSQSALTTARMRMRKQTAYGDSNEVLNTVPRHLIVPAELEELAWTLCTSVVSVGAAVADAELSRTAPNMHQGLNPIILPFLADPSDWYLAADPAGIPTIEIGFYLGKQDPEMFSQADGNAGSVFTADKYTLKIRQIYNGSVLDHRGFYGGVGVS